MMSEVLDELPEIVDPDSERSPTTGDDRQCECSLFRQHFNGNKRLLGNVNFDKYECGEEQNPHNEEYISV